MTWNLNLQDHGGQLISVVTVPSSSATPTSSPVPFEARCRISSSGLQAPAWPNLVLVLVLTLFFPVTLASDCRQWSQYVSHFVFFQRDVMWASCSKWKFWFQSSARFSFPNEAPLSAPNTHRACSSAPTSRSVVCTQNLTFVCRWWC